MDCEYLDEISDVRSTPFRRDLVGLKFASKGDAQQPKQRDKDNATEHDQNGVGQQGPDDSTIETNPLYSHFYTLLFLPGVIGYP